MHRFLKRPQCPLHFFPIHSYSRLMCDTVTELMCIPKKLGVLQTRPEISEFIGERTFCAERAHHVIEHFVCLENLRLGCRK